MHRIYELIASGKGAAISHLIVKNLADRKELHNINLNVA